MAGEAAARTIQPVALAFDYVLPAGFADALSLTIADDAGRLVRSIDAGSERAQPGNQAGDPDDPDMRSGGRGRGRAAGLTRKAGHNRYLWDYRWANGGPLVAPGKYTARLGSSVRTFEVFVDPAVLKDGVSVADLVEQQNFLLWVRDAQTRANQLRGRIQQAMQQASVPQPPSPGPGEWVDGLKYAHPLQKLWVRLVTAPGTYQQGMLIDQLANIVRAEGGADQKVGVEARKRFDDLLAELKDIEAELGKIAGGF